MLTEKVHVIVGDSYTEAEGRFNEFAKTVNIVDVKVIEKWDSEKDIGYIAYHIFYGEKK